MKKYIIVLMLSIFSGSVFAQGAQDALRYSQIYYMGTARSMAMGGAFGALGADLSVAATNPAGLGLYRVNEYSLSTYFTNTFAHSEYNNTASDGYKMNVGISNFGYVSAIRLAPKNSGGWQYVQFAIGMNKTNDFNSYTDMQGNNSQNSRIDSYLYNAYGINYTDLKNQDPYYLYPAWSVYLLDTIPGYTNEYYSPVPQGGVYQRDQIYKSGGVNEWFLSAAANFENKFFIGATLGFTSLHYKQDSYYSETFPTDSTTQLSLWGVDQSLETTGSGVNLKLGFLYQPVNWLRIGAAIHTPTWYYSMTDTWQTKTYADLPGWYTGTAQSDVGTYSYKLTTPTVLLGDVGIIIGKRGSISAEFENVNYSTMKLSASDYSFTNENDNIKKYYRSVNNIRLGTEWRFGLMDVRAGYAYYGSPYANNYNDGKREILSGGLGFNIGHYNLGLAAVHSLQKQKYYFYGNQYVPVNPSQNTFNKTSLVVSLSYRFY
ncbi:MAG: hypothetical protein JXR71_06415 [Bacteroidales bacterium]|nr:hypothetical protein [Bacteroidales bacterium]